MFTAVIVLLTPNAVNVPTLVMLGCAAVVNVPVTKFAVTRLPPAMFPALILPLTINPVNVPTLVMLGCAAVVSVPVNRLPLTVPELANTFPKVPLLVTASACVESVPVVLLNVKLALPA